MPIAFYPSRVIPKVALRKSSSYGITWAGLLLVLIASGLPADETPSAGHAHQPVSQSIDQLIQRLGSRSFIDREDAADEILSLGSVAESALAQSALSRDREVRDRSRRLLNVIRKQSQERYLAAFRSGANDQNIVPLPGWPAFSKRYGDSEASRHIFAEILSEEWDFIDAGFRATNEAQRRGHVRVRLHRMVREGLTYNNCKLGTALGLYFVCSEFPATGQAEARNLLSYMSSPELRPYLALQAKPTAFERQKLVRSIVGTWLVASRPESSPATIRTALHYARAFKLVEPGRHITRQILTNRDSLPVSISTAMHSIAIMNDRTQLELIKPFLNNKTILRANRQRVQQLRDVALACAMKLNGYDLSKIGVRPARLGGLYAFDDQSLGFITEGDRERAFKIYHELEAKKRS